MSVIEKLTSLVGSDDSPVKKRFRCHGCDSEFDSFKREGRASCAECLSDDVEVIEELS